MPRCRSAPVHTNSLNILPILTLARHCCHCWKCNLKMLLFVSPHFALCVCVAPRCTCYINMRNISSAPCYFFLSCHSQIEKCHFIGALGRYCWAHFIFKILELIWFGFNGRKNQPNTTIWVSPWRCERTHFLQTFSCFFSAISVCCPPMHCHAQVICSRCTLAYDTFLCLSAEIQQTIARWNYKCIFDRKFNALNCHKLIDTTWIYSSPRLNAWYLFRNCRYSERDKRHLSLLLPSLRQFAALPRCA